MKLAALGSVLLAFAAAAQAGAVPRAQEPALSLSVNAKPQPLRACGSVAWTLTVRNRSSQAVTLVFPSGQRGDVVLRRRGAVAYRWSADKAFTLAIEELTVPAGGVRRFVLRERRLRLVPGRYALEARITGKPAGAVKGLAVRRTVLVRRGTSPCAQGRASAPPTAGPQPLSKIGPPPASLLAASGEARLAWGSSCWFSGSMGVCVDAVPPGMRTDVPRIAVRPGETVRFALGFTPDEVSVSLGDAPTLALPPGRVVSWNVPSGFAPRPGGAVLQLRVRGDAGAAGSGSGSYVAWLVAPG